MTAGRTSTGRAGGSRRSSSSSSLEAPRKPAIVASSNHPMTHRAHPEPHLAWDNSPHNSPQKVKIQMVARGLEGGPASGTTGIVIRAGHNETVPTLLGRRHRDPQTDSGTS